MRRVLLAIATILALTSPAYAGPGPSWLGGTITVDLNKLLDQLGTAINVGMSAVADQRSAAQLALELANLAGEEEALADTLSQVAANPSLGHVGQNGSIILDRLNDQYGAIDESFSRIRTLIRKVDRQWAFRNISLTADIGGFAHDGIIYYQAGNGMTVWLDNPRAASQFAAELRHEALEVRMLAQRVGGTAPAGTH